MPRKFDEKKVCTPMGSRSRSKFFFVFFGGEIRCCTCIQLAYATNITIPSGKSSGTVRALPGPSFSDVPDHAQQCSPRKAYIGQTVH